MSNYFLSTSDFAINNPQSIKVKDIIANDITANSISGTITTDNLELKEYLKFTENTSYINFNDSGKIEYDTLNGALKLYSDSTSTADISLDQIDGIIINSNIDSTSDIYTSASSATALDINNILIVDTNTPEVIINADMTVNGTITAVDSLEVKDAIIMTGAENPADLVPLGIISEYNYSTTPNYRGLVYDPSDSKYNLLNTATKPVSSLSAYTNIDLRLNDLYGKNINLGDTTDTDTNINIINSTTGTGNIYFNDGSNSGRIEYSHTNNFMKLYANAKVKLDLRDTSVALGTTADASNNLNIYSASSSVQALTFNFSGVGERGRIEYDNSNNSMEFKTNATTALTIDSSQVLNYGSSISTGTSTLNVIGGTNTISGSSVQMLRFNTTPSLNVPQFLRFRGGGGGTATNGGIIICAYNTDTFFITGGLGSQLKIKYNSALDLTADPYNDYSDIFNLSSTGDLILGNTSQSATSHTIQSSTSGTGTINFNDGSNSGQIAYTHGTNDYMDMYVENLRTLRMSKSTNWFEVSNLSDIVLDGTGVGNDATLRLLSPNTRDSRILFGDPQSATVGGIYYDHTLDRFVFSTNNTTAIIVDSSQNVDIPSGTLTVGTGAESNTIALDSGTSSTSFINFDKAGTTDGRILYANNLGYMNFYTGGNTLAGGFTQTQNFICYGTTITAGTTANTYSFVALRSNNTSNQTILFGDGTDSGKINYSHATDTFDITANSVKSMTIRSTGATIGTSTTSGYISLESSASGTGSFHFYDGTNDATIAYNHSTQDMTISNKGNTAITIDNSGNVNIPSLSFTAGSLSGYAIRSNLRFRSTSVASGSKADGALHATTGLYPWSGGTPGGVFTETFGSGGTDISFSGGTFTFNTAGYYHVSIHLQFTPQTLGTAGPYWDLIAYSANATNPVYDSGATYFNANDSYIFSASFIIGITASDISGSTNTHYAVFSKLAGTSYHSSTGLADGEMETRVMKIS